MTLYAGLLGLGSDLSVAELARMVTPVAAESGTTVVLTICRSHSWGRFGKAMLLAGAAGPLSGSTSGWREEVAELVELRGEYRDARRTAPET